jgi:hypothetical protein
MRRSVVSRLSDPASPQFEKLVGQAGRWAIFFAEKFVHGIARQSECGQPTHPAGAVHTFIVWAGGLSTREQLARALHSSARTTTSGGSRRTPQVSGGKRSRIHRALPLCPVHRPRPFQPSAVSVARNAHGRTVGAVQPQ